MLGSAPEMTQEQALQAQNQQMKDFLSTYNKTTQVDLLFEVIKNSARAHKGIMLALYNTKPFIWKKSTNFRARFVSTIASKTFHRQN